MSTKKETTTQQTQTQQNTYDPASMSTFDKLQPQVSALLTQYMQDPRTSGMFNLRLQQAMGAVQQLGQQGASRITQNAIAGGFGGGNLNAFTQSMLAANSRATAGNGAQAYIQNLLGQAQLQQNAMNQAMGYRPLQTGGTATSNGETTETTSGLGTWLPQLAGAAIGAAGTFLSGGATAGLGALGGGAASSGLSAFNAPAGDYFNLLGSSSPMAGSFGQNPFFTPSTLSPSGINIGGLPFHG